MDLEKARFAKVEANRKALQEFRKLAEIKALDRVRTLIEDPKNWTRATYARDSQGLPCAPHAEQAVAWCLAGAVAHFVGGCANLMLYPAFHGAWDRLERAAKENGFPQVGAANDQLTHRGVLELIDLARSY